MMPEHPAASPDWQLGANTSQPTMTYSVDRLDEGYINFHLRWSENKAPSGTRALVHWRNKSSESGSNFPRHRAAKSVRVSAPTSG